MLELIKKVMHRIYIILLGIVLLSGCKSANTPDVSHIVADVKLIRTEGNLAEMDSKEKLETQIQSHKAFYKLYLKEILPLYKGENMDSLFADFRAFSQDSIVDDLRKKVVKKYANLDDIKRQADQMYRYLLYYFPERTSIPNLYTFISDFGYQIFIFEDDDKKDGIGIGLDMFMSPEVDYKAIDPDNTNFSDYITRSWNKDHIVKKIADLHVQDIVGETPGHRMLDQMIHNGKALYITELLLPEVHDSIIHEYSAAQLNWCMENELQMWSFFFDRKLFYESNPSKIAKYIYPSPTSPDMPSGAPGRTANYVGWKIIKAYMDRYPETTLQALINMKDSQEIMDKSKYKPQRK